MLQNIFPLRAMGFVRHRPRAAARGRRGAQRAVLPAVVRTERTKSPVPSGTWRLQPQARGAYFPPAAWEPPLHRGSDGRTPSVRLWAEGAGSEGRAQ